MTQFTRYSLIGALLVAICLGGYSSVLSSKLKASQQQSDEMQKTLAQQAGLIATLQMQDAQNRALMAAQQQQEQQLRELANTNERRYRNAIKDNVAAGERMPDAVLDLLRSSTSTGTNTHSFVPP